MKELIRVLEQSVERNGSDKPLTVGHLLNIVKMVQRNKNDRKRRRMDREQANLLGVDYRDHQSIDRSADPIVTR